MRWLSNKNCVTNEETGENLMEISVKYGHLVAQYCYLKFKYIARILAFENATVLAPKIITFIFFFFFLLSFSNPILLKVLFLKKRDNNFCGRRGIRYLSNNNLVANKK